MKVLLLPFDMDRRVFIAAKVEYEEPIVFDRLIVLPEPELAGA